jgi:D-alanyl-D-alanine carboxypeptidase (penicillin-binding protein 5/6)
MKTIIRRVLATFLVGMMLFPQMTFAAQKPEVTAETAILMEPTTGKIIYSKDIHKKMYPASMTKILTALVVMDYFSPDTLITVGTEINEVTLDSSKAGHKRGETLTVENLIRGLIIPSGNDTANVLAAAVAKKVENNNDLTPEESEKVFARLMNEKAKKLGAKESHFSNAHGYHDENHYTSAYDMALITREAQKNKMISEIAKEKSFSGKGVENNLESSSNLVTQEYKWKSHNLLITDNEYQYEYATGMKTGFTNEAGACLSATAEKDGTKLIAVLFKSEDPNRWIDAKKLFDYGFENYKIVALQKAGDVVKSIPLVKHNRLQGDTLDVVVKNDVTVYMKVDDVDKLKKVVTFSNEYVAENKKQEDTTIRLKAPIAKDAEVGTVSYQLDGKVVAQAKVYAAREVQKQTIFRAIHYFFKNLASNLFTLKTLVVIAVILGVGLIAVGVTKMIGGRRRSSRYVFKTNRRRRRFK